jgi:hypothetical protein
MAENRRTKPVREGKYIAEVEVDWTEAGDAWSPCVTVEDGYKLDDARAALRRGDVKAASQHGRAFTLTPVAI